MNVVFLLAVAEGVALDPAENDARGGTSVTDDTGATVCRRGN